MSGLLEEFKRYVSDAAPGGSLNPELNPAYVKGLLGFTPVVGDAISAYDAYKSAVNGNYGDAAINAVGLLPYVPSIAAPLSSNGKKIAEQLLIAQQKGEKVGPKVIGDLTPAQFADINSARSAAGFPQFKKNEVLYNGAHHYSSRSKDGHSIQEMLLQIENGLAPEASVIKSSRGPAIQNQTTRIDELGDTVKDTAVLEGGGERPMFLLSAYGKKQK